MKEEWRKEWKVKKSDFIFYGPAQRIEPMLARSAPGKKLINFSRGVADEACYREFFLLLVSRTLLYFSLSLLLSVLLLLLTEGSKEGVLLSLGLTATIISLPFVRLKRNYDRNSAELNIGLENLVNELSILVSSGMSLYGAVEIKRSARDSYEVMKKLYRHMEESQEKGMNISSSILVFGRIYRNKYLNKLNILISQSNRKGTGKQVESLISLGNEMMTERKSRIKKKTETISTRMLMPLMLSLFGIIGMIMLPIFMQF